VACHFPLTEPAPAEVGGAVWSQTTGPGVPTTAEVQG
jgi:hypothetical protein